MYMRVKASGEDESCASGCSFDLPPHSPLSGEHVAMSNVRYTHTNSHPERCIYIYIYNAISHHVYTYPFTFVS